MQSRRSLPANAGSRPRYSISPAEAAKAAVNASRFSVSDIFKKSGKRQDLMRRATLPASTEEMSPTEKRKSEMAQRAVVVRSVYSSARKSLQRRSRIEADSLSPGEKRQPKRLTLQLAAKSIQDGARQLIHGRNLVESFMEVSTQSEKIKLENEMIRIEKARDDEEKGWKRQGLLTVQHFNGQASFLTSLLEELRSFRTTDSGADTTNDLVAEMMANMKELMIKMDALKSMYSMDRRNCLALNSAIDSCVADVQKRFAKVSDTMKHLSESVQGLGGDVAQQMKDQAENVKRAVGDGVLSNLAATEELEEELEDSSASARPAESLIDRRLDPHDGELRAFLEIEERLQLEDKSPKEILQYWSDCEVKAESSEHDPGAYSEEAAPAVEATKPRKSLNGGLWRKAAIIMSFERCLFGGTMQALQGAVQDISRVAEEAGHKPLALPGLSDKPGTPGQHGEGDMHGRASRHWRTAGLVKIMSGMAKSRQSVQFLDETASGSKPSTCETDVPTSTLSGESVPEEKLPQPRRPPGTPLSPAEYPAIGGDPLILPSSVEQLVFGRETPEMTLERRLKSPFVLLPLVPTAKQLPPLQAPKRIRKAYKKRDTSCSTLETVLADRERRGLRQDGEDELDHELF